MTAIERLSRRIPLVIAVNVLVAISGMGFQILLSRRLDPAVFGSYVAILSLLCALGQVMESYSLAIAREQASDRRLVSPGQAIRFATALGLICSIAFLLFDAGTSASTNGLALLAAASSVLLVWSVLWFLRGVAQGQERETDYVLSRGVEMLSRLVLGLGLLWLGQNLELALLASALGAVIAVVHLVYTLRRSGGLHWAVHAGGTVSRHFRAAARMIATFIPLAIFIRLDTILAPGLLTSGDLGTYGVLSTVGKAVLLYSLVMSPLIFPHAVRSKKENEWIPLLGVGCLLSTGLMMVTAAAFYLAGPDLIEATFGSRYRGAGDMMGYYLLALAPMAIHGNVINLQMARGKGLSLGLLWFGLAAYWITLTLVPETMTEYIIWIAASNAVLSALGFLGLWLEQRAYRPQAIISRSEAGIGFGDGTCCGADRVSSDTATSQIEREGTPVA